MNEDKLLDLLTKQAPEIASKLSISTDQLYNKLVWYIRIDGILDTLVLLFVGVVMAVYVRMAYVEYRKECRERANADSFPYIINGVVLFLLIGVVASVVVSSLVRVFLPDYIIIEKVLQTAGL